MKGWKKYPFLLMLLISGAVYGGTEVLSKAGQERTEEIAREESQRKENTQTGKAEIPYQQEKGAGEGKKQESQPDRERSEERKEGAKEQTGTELPAEEKEKSRPRERKFTRVEMDYLEDALFIGDSRTSTLYEYAGWEKTDFFCKYGLTVWDVWDNNMDGKTLENMLSAKQYGKIYIGLGINELGTGTPDSYARQFQSVVERVRQLQPDAVIFVEAIMHVTQGKDDENTYINNQEINARNEKLKGLANEKDIFYIDVNEAMDEPGTGKLKAEYTFDGVHLQVKYIDIWREFLLNHGIQ